MSNHVPTQCKMSALFFPPINKITEAKSLRNSTMPQSYVPTEYKMSALCFPPKNSNSVVLIKHKCLYHIFQHNVKYMHCFSRQTNHNNLVPTKHKVKDVCINVPVACKISALFFPPKIPMN